MAKKSKKILQRKGDSIKDKLKYDKDLEAIRQELENKEIRELLG